MSEVLTDPLICDRLSPDIVSGAQLVLSDLDGCLVSEGRAFADAAAFVSACDDRLWIVSNNSTHTARALSRELAEAGLVVAPDRILLAGEQTLQHLGGQQPGVSVALYAGDGLSAAARAFGLDLDSAAPEVVVLCRDLGFSIRDLERLIRQLRGGARLWVSNLDASHPAADGRPVPETGALFEALRAVVGEVAYECLGKPHPYMARLALDRSGVPAGEAVFVGDSAATDGAVARALGIPFAHLVREAVA